jgi:hypothetical protein
LNTFLLALRSFAIVRSVLVKYVVVVVHVYSPNASDIIHVLQREPKSGKAWVLVGIVFPSEEHIHAAVCELFEQTIIIIMTADDLTLLSGKVACAPLPDSKTPHVNVYDAFVPVPNVTINLRTPVKVEHVVLSQSTSQLDGSYVVPASIAIESFIVTPSGNCGVNAIELK